MSQKNKAQTDEDDLFLHVTFQLYGSVRLDKGKIIRFLILVTAFIIILSGRVEHTQLADLLYRFLKL